MQVLKKIENQGKESDIDAVNPASDMGTNWEATDKEHIAGAPSITRPSPGAWTLDGSMAAASLSVGIRKAVGGDAADTG